MCEKRTTSGKFFHLLHQIQSFEETTKNSSYIENKENLCDEIPVKILAKNAEILNPEEQNLFMVNKIKESISDQKNGPLAEKDINI